MKCVAGDYKVSWGMRVLETIRRGGVSEAIILRSPLDDIIHRKRGCRMGGGGEIAPHDRNTMWLLRQKVISWVKMF